MSLQLQRANVLTIDHTAIPTNALQLRILLTSYAFLQQPLNSPVPEPDCTLVGHTHSIRTTLPYTFALIPFTVYIDPSDCSQYFDCPSENENAVLFRCPDRSVYDSRLQSCAINNGTFFWATPPTAAASRSFLPTPTCLPVTCPRFFVGNLPMRSNPAFYVFCFETTRMVFRCPDPDNQVFDPRLDRQRCSFKCSAAGHFIDRQDCHRFYTCTRRGLLLTVEQHRCPEGYWFSGNKRCELEDTECVPELPMRQ